MSEANSCGLLSYWLTLQSCLKIQDFSRATHLSKNPTDKTMSDDQAMEMDAEEEAVMEALLLRAFLK